MGTSVAPSFKHLAAHSIFPPENGQSGSDEDEWELVNEQSVSVASHKTSKVVVRDRDLIVGMGKEVRATSLNGNDWEELSGSVGRYKTLKTDLDFAIQSLVVSPTGRHLAVVGKTQVSALELPKSSSIGTSSGEISCRSFAIDEFQFSPTSSAVITKVVWHPWGENGTSLWVLTADGKLREYDIGQPSDPVQTFSFLDPSAASSSRFTAVDPLSRYATSFAFAPPTSDFGPTIVRVLMANGDLYQMGPVLPFRAEVPLRWLQAVKVDVKKDGPKLQWVDGLVKQVRPHSNADVEGDEDDMEAPIGVKGSRRDPTSSTQATENDLIKVHPPHLTSSGGPAPGTHRALLRQGPVVFSPAPHDIGVAAEEEDVAGDLMLSQSDEGDVFLAIAWSGGRVDLGVLVDEAEPKWIGNKKDEDDAEPTIPIIESVDLRLPADKDTAVASNAPIFVRDPLESSKIFVQHSFGIDLIDASPWLLTLRSENGPLPSSTVKSLVSSSLPNPITGAAALCNLSMGYGLVAVATSGQVAALEMDVAPEIIPAASQETSKDSQSITAHDDRSVLLMKPFDYSQLRTELQPLSKEATQNAKQVGKGKQLLDISIADLRMIGSVVQELQSRIDQVRTASRSLERHFDACVAEYQRQIKLARRVQVGVNKLEDSKLPVRIVQVTDKQKELVIRLDKVLKDLRTDSEGRTVTDAERKWFKELEALRKEVQGDGLGVEMGLVGRSQVASDTLRALSQGLDDWVKEHSPAAESDDRFEQVKTLQQTAHQKSEEIRQLMKRMEALNVKMDGTISARSR